MNETDQQTTCFLCGSSAWHCLAELNQRPERETDFGIPVGHYHRRIVRCGECGVCVSRQQMLAADMYAQQYNEATYKNQLVQQFDRIVALPEGKSDNKQRVARVVAFLRGRELAGDVPRVLDVGSGLCVFLAELKQHGMYCECVDPDPLSAEHARRHAGVDKAVAGSFDAYRPDQVFDVIAFNKVLEHVADPVGMLRHARECLADGGVVYVELPDAEGALANGTAEEREEFFIEHHAVYSPDSLKRLAAAADYSVVAVEQLHEPSDKYTIAAFFAPDSEVKHG